MTTVVHDIRNRTRGGQGKRPLARIQNVARHHSATTAGDYFAFGRRWFDQLGWSTGGYHEIILRDGSVQLCYSADVITNGIGNHNTGTYHICVVGNGSFTEKQEEVFRERAALALKRFGLGVDRLLGHNEFKGTNTACPGINMDEVRKRQRGYIPGPAQQTGGTQVEAPSKPAPAKPAVPKPNVNQFVLAAQKFLNSRSYPTKAKFTKLVEDGIAGRLTSDALIRLYQYFASVTIDGKFGPQSKRAANTLRRGSTHQWWVRLLQSALNAHGHKLAVDGVFGNGTENAVRVFQRSRRLTQDGIAGPNTWEQLFR